MTNIQMIDFYTQELFKASNVGNEAYIQWLEKAVNNRLKLISEGKETL